MEQQVTVMQWYVVTGTAGATVSTPEGVTLCTIPDGGQGSFFAITPIVVTSDASVSVVKATFNYAPAKLRALGLLGGGVSTLPAGYLAAEFLEFGGADKYVEVTTPWTAPGDIVRVEAEERFYRLDVGSDEIGNGSHANYFFWGISNKKWYIGCGSYGVTNYEADTNWHNMQMEYSQNGGAWVDGVKVRGCSYSSTAKILHNFTLGRTTPTVNSLTYIAYSQVKKCKLTVNGTVWRAVQAAIDPSGKPCMYDRIEKESFYNGTATALKVGMTLAQARQLGKLPAGGGTLKVSLPSNYLENEGVVNAIAEANAKGWNIEVASTWEATGASATFALRRIWVRKTQDEQGNYVAADGTRWAVESCVAMYNADGSEPDAHGYEPYRSVDAAVAYWELMPYANPEEELLTEI